MAASRGLDLGRYVKAALREPMVAAVVAAGGVTAVLAWLVLGPLAAAPEGGRTPVALAAAVTTATAPSTDRPSPTAVAPTASPALAPSPTAPLPLTPTAMPPTPTAAPPTATAVPPTATVAPTATPTRTATPTPTVAALYTADTEGGLADWDLGPSWALTDDLLVNDAAGLLAEPWLVAPYQPADGAYAIEAEIRVEGLVAGACDQSFGVVAGEADGVVWGGGVQWGCDEAGPRAQITDVSTWTDGYNQDWVLDVKGFDPGRAWRTYRLEVRGGQLRFLIDGALVAEAADPTGGQAGLAGGRLVCGARASGWRCGG